ncbi:threonine/serine ThrE exporter family protein [Streptomyces sp. NRRL S-146]|uniref:threonine/serine ThrE exporter family protein n=1 Tax=Streptomyces sp. NRRL S-146 TaxID=1463884 RepID=UPI0004CC7A3A|nr:threonine/serine exporter family protein [Streptomyces sp. NRRL S-146]
MTDAEDRKPRSDEARNAFLPPAGTGVDGDMSTTSEFAIPDGLALHRAAGAESETTSEFAVPQGLDVHAAPAVDQEGSAFTPPSTYSSKHAPTAFTPPSGIPVVSLTKDVPWQDRMRTMLRMPVAERPAPEAIQRGGDESGPAVPRVLDLTLRIGELLLAGGEGAEDVEAAMFAVCRSYGLDRCEPNVTFTLLAISYQPSLVDDPVTASRTVRRRGTDYTRLAAVYQLVDDLSDHETAVSLEEAYRRLAEIRRNRHPYPGWALTGASGLLAGAASVLVGGDLIVFVAAALGAMLGDLTGFYITASARLLEVMYFFVGIVAGVLLVLYFGVQLGARLNPDQALGASDDPVMMIGASMLLSLAFAVLLQQERSTVMWVTLNGGVAWVVFGAMHYVGDISPVASTAAAAGLVGLFGQLLSRYQFASALPYTTAAIGPLLPGSATYFGLLAIAQNEVDEGLVSLSKAVALAMAIAIGVNLGSEISRMFLRIGSAEKRRAAKRTRGF